MIKMVVSDMDGTLLKSDLSISKKNLEAIQYLRNKNILFSVATGRPDQLMKEYVDILQLKDPFIMYNGTVIGHPFLEERIYEKSLNTVDVKNIISYLDAHNIIYMIYTKERIISKPHYRSLFFQKRNASLKREHQSTIEDIPNVLEHIEQHKIIKILAIEHDKEKYMKLKSTLETNPNLSVVMSQEGFLDINPIGTSKGTALSYLADYYQLLPEEIVVFGDQENDVTMFQFAKTAIAMGNANEYVKNHATSVTASNNEDGFALWVLDNL